MGLWLWFDFDRVSVWFAVYVWWLVLAAGLFCLRCCLFCFVVDLVSFAAFDLFLLVVYLFIICLFNSVYVLVLVGLLDLIYWFGVGMF